MSTEIRAIHLGGPGTAVEIDALSFGGCLKLASQTGNRLGRRLAKNQTGKRPVRLGRRRQPPCVISEPARSTLNTLNRRCARPARLPCAPLASPLRKVETA
jgi:hypothetical protein